MSKNSSRVALRGLPKYLCKSSCSLLFEFTISRKWYVQAEKAGQKLGFVIDIEICTCQIKYVLLILRFFLIL